MVGTLPREGAQGRGERAGRGLWESGERRGRAPLAAGTSCVCARGAAGHGSPSTPIAGDAGASLKVGLPLAAGWAGALRPALTPCHVQASSPGGF